MEGWKLDVIQRLKKVCELNGLDIYDEQQKQEMDSVMYISIIVDLEGEFQIEFPDEVLSRNFFEDINSLCNIIENLLYAVKDSN